MALFTPEELAELERADAEIEDGFRLTNEDLRRSRALDKEARLERKDGRGCKIAAQQAAYREANKEKRRDYMREYMRKRRAKMATA